MQRNKKKRDETIAKRQKAEQDHLLEKLRQMPVLQVAFSQSGTKRSTYYRWHNADALFREAADTAIAEGEAFITELSESKLIALISREHFPALQLWLRTHHHKYAAKLELTGDLQIDEVLTPDQEALVGEALRLAALTGDTSHDAPEPDHSK